MTHSSCVDMVNRVYSGSNDSGDVVCSIHSSFDDVQDLREPWDAIVEASGAEIFLTFDWCRTWWDFYGHKRTLSLCVFRRDHEVVGLLPLFIERVRLGPVSVRAAKIVGSDFTLTQFTLPVKRECLPQVIDAFAGVAESQQWDICSLGPLSGFSHGQEDLRSLFGRLEGGSWRVQIEETGVHTVFELPGSWDEYLALLSKKERQLIRSNYRKIEADGIQVQRHVATKEDFAEVFGDFVTAHQEQWRQLGKAGHFGDWPRSEDFHRAVAQTQLERNRLHLLKVRVAADCVAYQYSYRMGQRYFEILMGRSSGDESHAVDMGRLLFAEQAQRAIEQGIRNIDSMRGRYEYKLRLGGKLFPLLRVRIVRKGACRELRVAGFGMCASLFDKAYYKLWYCRLGPKWSASRGPLWSTWIRSEGLKTGKRLNEQ